MDRAHRAPSLNVKSFLVDTTDQAIQQIITLGVPGTAMPAWGDCMTDAEIQAIVGFLCRWEATAPEVAQPLGPPSGVGGPPWLRNQAQPTATPATQSISPTQTPLPDEQPLEQVLAEPTPTTVVVAQQSGAGAGHTGQGQGQGGPPWTQEQTQTSADDALDWRVLILIGSGFAVAFTLIAMGFSLLMRTRQSPPST